jgi:hypothetical protein
MGRDSSTARSQSPVTKWSEASERSSQGRYGASPSCESSPLMCA